MRHRTSTVSARPATRALRWLHMYAGLMLALPLLALFSSGVALVYKETFWKWSHPVLAEPAPERTTEEHAQVINQLQARFDDTIGLIKLPPPDLPAYQLWLTDGSEALVHADTLELVDRWHWWQRPTGWLAELHIHLLAGEAGALLVGWIGLAMAVLLLAGAAAWWPLRRLFRWRSILPSGTRRGQLLMLHRNAGVLILPLALVLVVCGSGVAFFQPARVLLNGLFGDAESARRPLSEAPARIHAHAAPRPLAELMNTASAALPDARITFVYPDRGDSGVLMIRARHPDEAHPNGLSFVHLDRVGGEVLRVVNAHEAPPGDRLANWMYPLHSGKWGGPIWPAMVALHGAILIVLLLAGITSWYKHRAPIKSPAAGHRPVGDRRV